MVAIILGFFRNLKPSNKDIKLMEEAKLWGKGRWTLKDKGSYSPTPTLVKKMNISHAIAKNRNQWSLFCTLLFLLFGGVLFWQWQPFTFHFPFSYFNQFAVGSIRVSWRASKQNRFFFFTPFLYIEWKITLIVKLNYE